MRAGAQDDDGVGGFAPFGGGDADDGDLGDGGWPVITLSTSAGYTFSPPVTIMSVSPS